MAVTGAVSCFLLARFNTPDSARLRARTVELQQAYENAHHQFVLSNSEMAVNSIEGLDRLEKYLIESRGLRGAVSEGGTKHADGFGNPFWLRFDDNEVFLVSSGADKEKMTSDDLQHLLHNLRKRNGDSKRNGDRQNKDKETGTGPVSDNYN